MHIYSYIYIYIHIRKYIYIYIYIYYFFCAGEYKKTHFTGRSPIGGTKYADRTPIEDLKERFGESCSDGFGKLCSLGVDSMTHFTLHAPDGWAG